jgi:protein TonB
VLALKTDNMAYFSAVSRRNWATWLLSVIGALVLNTALFGGMPHLLHPRHSILEFEKPVAQINVVRMKRPESPVKRQTEKPSEPPPKPEHKQRPVEDMKLQARLSLPFELNPRLPEGPNMLALPEMEPPKFDAALLDDAFSVGDLDAPLTVVSRVSPVYPAQAKYKGIQGWVTVRFVVSETGKAGDITVMKSEPPGVFDQSVIRCVSGWRFKPGTVEGVAVKVLAETTIRFALE